MVLGLRIEEKGKRGQATRRVIRLPIVQRAVAGHASAVPRVAELLRRYFRARKRASPAVPEFAKVGKKATWRHVGEKIVSRRDWRLAWVPYHPCPILCSVIICRLQMLCRMLVILLEWEAVQ